jgi:hypothetical protein
LLELVQTIGAGPALSRHRRCSTVDWVRWQFNRCWPPYITDFLILLYMICGLEVGALGMVGDKWLSII